MMSSSMAQSLVASLRLCLEEQFFLIMTRLRLGLSVADPLVDRFEVPPSAVSRIFSMWVNLMYSKFHQLPTWLSQLKFDKPMPPSFKKLYSSTRVVIDCTEFSINIPSSFVRKSNTWSCYRNHNTVKCLIGIAPHGHVTFVS